ncbi:MAG: hypothetical protein HUU47_08155 [Bacteroidetes bacterium]|nr:hypothetical protein [Bacteroidota bacterium]
METEKIYNENCLITMKKEIHVNMPDCSNLLFNFDDNNKIIKSKRIADNDSKNAILYYKLTTAIQNSIDKYLNPNAI